MCSQRCSRLQSRCHFCPRFSCHFATTEWFGSSCRFCRNSNKHNWAKLLRNLKTKNWQLDQIACSHTTKSKKIDSEWANSKILVGAFQVPKSSTLWQDSLANPSGSIFVLTVETFENLEKTCDFYGFPKKKL